MPSSRKAAAIALARLVSRHHATFDQTVPPGLRGQPFVLNVRRPIADELDEVEQLTLEHTTQVSAVCALLAWHLRMEVRNPGALASFHSKLAGLRKQVEVQGATVADCIAYYLHVAPAMFAFYLLLWELVLTIELDPAVQDV